jgi:hypothetical protein
MEVYSVFFKIVAYVLSDLKKSRITSYCLVLLEKRFQDLVDEGKFGGRD